MRNFFNRGALALASVLAVGFLPAISSATGCDPYATLVSAVSFSTVLTDVVAVAALVVAVLVAIRGIRFIYGIVRR